MDKANDSARDHASYPPIQKSRSKAVITGSCGKLKSEEANETKKGCNLLTQAVGNIILPTLSQKPHIDH